MAEVVPIGQRRPAEDSCIINGNKNVNINIFKNVNIKTDKNVIVKS